MRSYVPGSNYLGAVQLWALNMTLCWLDTGPTQSDLRIVA